MTTCLMFDLSLKVILYILYASSKSVAETALMHRLALNVVDISYIQFRLEQLKTTTCHTV